jgi:two-component system nitrate/nitrite sensor histidine kinase NarX
VLQEALSNVRKHAGATQVGIDVLKGARWRFSVCDNGIGFDTGHNRGESHVGMKIMSERAARIGAEVTVRSVPGQGATVTLTLPLHPATGNGAASVPDSTPDVTPATEDATP